MTWIGACDFPERGQSERRTAAGHPNTLTVDPTTAFCPLRVVNEFAPSLVGLSVPNCELFAGRSFYRELVERPQNAQRTSVLPVPDALNSCHHGRLTALHVAVVDTFAGYSQLLTTVPPEPILTQQAAFSIHAPAPVRHGPDAGLGRGDYGVRYT